MRISVTTSKTQSVIVTGKMLSPTDCIYLGFIVCLPILASRQEQLEQESWFRIYGQFAFIIEGKSGSSLLIHINTTWNIASSLFRHVVAPTNPWLDIFQGGINLWSAWWDQNTGLAQRWQHCNCFCSFFFYTSFLCCVFTWKRFLKRTVETTGELWNSNKERTLVYQFCLLFIFQILISQTVRMVCIYCVVLPTGAKMTDIT